MAVTTPSLKRTNLTEVWQGCAPLLEGEERVDRVNGVIKGVRICGTRSKNKRRYTTEALRAAIPLYEGAKVKFSHPKNPDDERPFSDTIGWLRGVHQRNDGALYGDLHYLRSHKYAESICEAAERNPTIFGLSHNADGDTSLDSDGSIVVSAITELRSVDLVDGPATNSSLFESFNGGKRIKTTVKRLLEALSVRADVPRATRKKLLEMMDDEQLMDEPAMEAEVEMDSPPDSGDHNEHLASGFKAALAALVNEDMPEKDLLKRLKDIIRAKSSLLGGDGAKDAGAEEEEPVVEAEDEECAPDGKPFGKKDDMKESIRRLHRTNAALSLLLESGVTKPSPLLLKTLSLLESDTDRRQLLHEQRVGGQGNTPRSLPPSGHGTGAKQAVTAKSRLEAWTGQKFKDN